jgi:hypothetical protein
LLEIEKKQVVKNVLLKWFKAPFITLLYIKGAKNKKINCSKNLGGKK